MPMARSMPSARIRDTASGMNGGECFIPRYSRKRSPPAFSRSTAPAGLRPRRVEQREDVADRGVTIPQLGEVLGRGSPPSADVRVVALDILRPARGAVGHEQHADGHHVPLGFRVHQVDQPLQRRDRRVRQAPRDRG